jgi:RNA polymerase-interacting CarD/CdnL/TRCF family regulator
MNKRNEAFQVGDQVIHWAHGPGEVIKLDEKCLSGRIQLYYVVQMRDMKLWVPVEQSNDCSLRPPTPKREFEDLFKIFASSAVPLSSDRNKRRLQLIERLKDHELASICGVIRDLTQRKSLTRMTMEDNTTLERSKDFFINELSLVFSIPIQQAEIELGLLLEGENITP